MQPALYFHPKLVSLEMFIVGTKIHSLKYANVSVSISYSVKKSVSPGEPEDVNFLKVTRKMRNKNSLARTLEG